MKIAPSSTTTTLDTVSATIENLSHDGRGITHINGKITFVDGALPQETIQLTYTRKHSRYNEAKITHITTPSPQRTTPKCQHFDICGGCSLQHMLPNYQINYKQAMLLEQLKHFGKLEPAHVLEPITGPIWEYRRKARLGVRYVAKKQSVLVGFREKNSRYLADLHHCEILHPSIGNLIDPLRELMMSLDSYQDIPQIEVAVGDKVSALVFRHLKPLSENDLNKLRDFAAKQTYHSREGWNPSLYQHSAMTEMDPRLRGDDTDKLENQVEYPLHIYLQPGKAESVYRLYPPSPARVNTRSTSPPGRGEKDEIDGRRGGAAAGSPSARSCASTAGCEGDRTQRPPLDLSYHLPDHDLELLFHPNDFIQVNSLINRKLCRLAIDLLAPQPNDIILDLFCGLGNFTLAIARHCQKVIGIEGDPVMTKRAQANAKHNNIHNTEFFAANLEADFSNAPWIHEKPTKIFIDPPRTGALTAIQQLSQHPVTRIVYVSCNPATLARDAGILVHEQGYRLTQVGVIDMFPHTNHVESIAVFEK